MVRFNNFFVTYLHRLTTFILEVELYLAFLKPNCQLLTLTSTDNLVFVENPLIGGFISGLFCVFWVILGGVLCLPTLKLGLDFDIGQHWRQK